ncbi:hypothetical protein GFS60_08218 (plasmid) [Rhodococcus sp. WAY2]|nr:hypothetical protein GFS60_08218 [Rhodococcus sp. WAY2]
MDSEGTIEPRHRTPQTEACSTFTKYRSAKPKKHSTQNDDARNVEGCRATAARWLANSSSARLARCMAGQRATVYRYLAADDAQVTA